jgi:hypothetical protein
MARRVPFTYHQLTRGGQYKSRAIAGAALLEFFVKGLLRNGLAVERLG